MNVIGLKKSLNVFLSNEIKFYNTLQCSEKLYKYYEIKMTKYDFSKEELLKIFYFNRFFSIIYHSEIKNKIIKEIPLNENKFFISAIEDVYINKIWKNISNNDIESLFKNLHFFLDYGNYRKTFIDKLYRNYLKNFKEIKNEKFHVEFIKIFVMQDLINICEEKCILNIIKNIDKKPNLTRTEFFILHHFWKKLNSNINNKNEKIEINFNINRNPINHIAENFLNITKTQTNIKRYLQHLKIDFKEEFQEDGFSYDYYLPSLNTVLEFDGPLHFYPLQSQYLDKFKFRFKVIDEIYKRRIVYIPYFEWMKLDTESFSLEYLRKIIYKKWDFNDTNCFKESYDITNIERKFI